MEERDCLNCKHCIARIRYDRYDDWEEMLSYCNKWKRYEPCKVCEYFEAKPQ